MATVLDTPVLFLVFNRPDLARRVFARIRAARPARLFVAADGTRPDRPEDVAACRETREVIAGVDWPCEVKTLFRETNLGCRDAVSSAISWFFEQVDAGIILEDDGLPDPSFFPFCAELLERYRDNAQIMSISGDSFFKESPESDFSYSFSIYHHIWGWATWRRAWRHYDPSLTNRHQLFDYKWLYNLLESDEAARYWSNIITRYHDGLIDTWDYPWLFSCWINRGLSIAPAVNLVTNIGFDPRSTHTKQSNSSFVCPFVVMRFPLRHPPVVKRNISIERSSEKTFFSTEDKLKRDLSFMAKAKECLQRLLALR